MFVTSRLLEMGFSMRHIYWAMEAAGTAFWNVSDTAENNTNKIKFLICFSFFNICCSLWAALSFLLSEGKILL